jgi:predicted ATPase
MSEKLQICTLEAASFSGKTTLAKLLEKSGIRTVQEYARYSSAKYPVY